MVDFWVKKAISILRQNGSREPADAVAALAARLAEREETVRKFGTVQHKLLCRAEAAETRLAETDELRVKQLRQQGDAWAADAARYKARLVEAERDRDAAQRSLSEHSKALLAAEARLAEAKGLLEEIGDEWPAVKRTTVERAYAFIERAADNAAAQPDAAP